MLAHSIIKSLVYLERIVVVLRTVHPALRDVQVYGVIPRLGDLHSIFFEGLHAQTVSLTGDELHHQPLTLRPRSSSVRSSTLPAITFHRQSTSAMYPRHSGLAAVKASYIRNQERRKWVDANTHAIMGPMGMRESYMRRDWSMLQHWKVSCRQQHPIPKPIASM